MKKCTNIGKLNLGRELNAEPIRRLVSISIAETYKLH